jgi:hypothetical protein
LDFWITYPGTRTSGACRIRHTRRQEQPEPTFKPIFRVIETTRSERWKQIQRMIQPRAARRSSSATVYYSCKRADTKSTRKGGGLPDFAPRPFRPRLVRWQHRADSNEPAPWSAQPGHGALHLDPGLLLGDQALHELESLRSCGSERPCTAATEVILQIVSCP